MTTLADIVSIERRFARSARIDRDLAGTPPLVGYVLQASVAKSLTAMACGQIESGQGAFTWTGPYGGGKSCAALLVANLVGGVGENKAIAREIAGDEIAGLFEEAFPARVGRWDVVAVTGSRTGLRGAVAAAAQASLGWSEERLAEASASDDALIDALLAPRGRGRKPGGTLLILDELGKLLEFAALHGGDVHLLQDLAERAARSEGRLVVLGILHQAFDQYAARADRDARREWAKVQGRFQDLPILAGPDETVALLGRAIGCAKPPRSAGTAASAVAVEVARRRPIHADTLAVALAATWPLNPITALLLGPVSRQRFAQNERSVFGFLSSSEPSGFQEHLATTPSRTPRTYDPDRLWDYLATNFGMALAGGQDGARFSLAFEAIERAAAKGGPLHVSLTKAAAIIEFFRNGSGAAVSDEFLALSVPYAKRPGVDAAIADLLSWAILMPQPRLGGYALFAGSDFDLDEAVSRVASPPAPAELNGIPAKIGMPAVAAKRHYLRTGTLRTFDVVLDLATRAEKPGDVVARLMRSERRGAGMLVLVANDGTFDRPEIDVRCKIMAKAFREAGAIVAVGTAADQHDLPKVSSELLALERVMRDNPRLEGDRIARREIGARHVSTVELLQRRLDAALNEASWRLSTDESEPARQPLAVLASSLADKAFDKAPILHSELLQREKPSSSAMAAVRTLMHHIVDQPLNENLGITGYPAEMGLYVTVLSPFGLHRAVDGAFDFHGPLTDTVGASLAPAWSVIEDATDITLDQVYATWATAPFGMKAGVMPLLALANLMSRRDRVAVYVDGVFQTDFDDVLADKLLQRPEAIRIRRIDRSVQEAAYLSGLARAFELPHDAPALAVAQTLYRRFEVLPAHAQRTKAIPPEAIAVRDAVLRANDPENLLFERIPDALGGRLSADAVLDGLESAEAVYGLLLNRLRAALARGLGVDPTTFEGLSIRADNLRDLTNDYAFEAFAMRAAAFDGGQGEIEGLASLLLHRPPHTWSDRDADQALLEIASLCRRFREAEALAIVRDRTPTAEALALVVGLDANVPPVVRSFILTEAEKTEATALADQLLTTLRAGGRLGSVQLAALARAIAGVALEDGATTIQTEAA
jgi:hypothetical protein